MAALRLTSSDVVDTALAMLMAEACGLILDDVAALLAVLRDRAHEFKHAPMIGRTHGVHAEPMTFGLKLARWHAELERDRARIERGRETITVGKLSGAVGTFSHLPPEVEEAVCERLGLKPAPIASQVLQRDRHAEVMAALAVCAATLETRHRDPLFAEDRGPRGGGPFGERQKGSSAMPHKRNPVGCEQVSGLARLVRANASAAFESIALWHERDISHSSVERVIIPDSFLVLDHMLRHDRDRPRRSRAHRPHAAEPESTRAWSSPATPDGAHRPGMALEDATARGADPRHGRLEGGRRFPPARGGRPRHPQVLKGSGWTTSSGWSGT